MYSYFFLSVKTFLQLDRSLPLSHHLPCHSSRNFYIHSETLRDSKTQTGEWRWSEYVVSASVVLRQT